MNKPEKVSEPSKKSAARQRVLRCWNGCALWMRREDDERWKNVPFNGSVSGYVAAYSRADARRVIAQYTGMEPSDTELREYWSECWGNSMDGITCERGLWIQFSDHEKPVRVV
jgi:hypothetical protein